ncbi:universal stress protein [Nostoc sp.]|uniref:universal stress protein n=1 Tax=Nostoc sp. TaxID=1180 RepID=UPI003FA5BFF8
MSRQKLGYKNAVIRQLPEIFQLNIKYQHHFGEPGATISSVAQEWNADLIVLGRHDHSAIAEFFVGSVSNHVVDHANCSVLVIKDTNPDKDK